MFSDKKWHNFCLLSVMTMVVMQWFDEAKRHHQVKVMGEPRAARDAYPSNIYISIISRDRRATCEAL